MRDSCRDPHTTLGTITPCEQQHEQPLPSSVAKHEEEDAEDDARDANVDPNDDAGRGGFIVLLVLHAVARGIQHCQKKGGERVSGSVCILLLQLLGSPDQKLEPGQHWELRTGKKRAGWESSGVGGSLPAKAVPLLLVP